MIAPGDRRPAGRAVPQNRQLNQVPQRQRPPPPTYAQPAPTQQEYQTSPFPPSQPPYRQQQQQTFPTPGYDEDDDFPESQAPQGQGYAPAPMQHMPYYDAGPSTPAQNVRPARPPRPRMLDTYSNDVSPSQPMRRPAGEGQQGQGQGVKASRILAAVKQIEPRIDGLVSDTHGIRDAVHDLGQQMQVIPGREDIKDDMREYIGPALVQMKSDIMDAIKDARRENDERYRSLSDQIAGLRSKVANLPQQNSAVAGPDKTTTALLESLIASLRPIDELKNLLLPLNLPQTMLNLVHMGTHISSLHSKIDQNLELSKAIPAAQTTQLDVLRALTKVDARCASQEQAGKDSQELMKKVDDRISSLQAESSTNREALSAIRKEVEARAEAEREAAWRRNNSVEQSTQTTPPAAYVNQQTATPTPAAYVDQQTTTTPPASYVNQQTGTDRLDLAHFTTPPQVFEALPSSIPPEANAPRLVLRPTDLAPTASSSTMAASSQAAAVPTPDPTPKPAPKKKPLKRKATQARKPMLAPWLTDSFEEAEMEKEAAASAAGKEPAASSNDPADVFGPVTQLPTPPTTGPRNKKRKVSAQSQSSSPGSAAQRRSRRARKSPTRFGQGSQSPVEQDGAAASVLVPGTQQPTAPGGAMDHAPKLARTATNGIIDLAADSLNSIESGPSGTQSQDKNGAALDPQPNVSSSPRSAVAETQIGSIEPPQVTRSATQRLDTLDRRAYLDAQGSDQGSPGLELLARCASSRQDKTDDRPGFLGNQGERIGLDDPLGGAIETDDLTGSQLLGFETDESV